MSSCLSSQLLHLYVFVNYFYHISLFLYCFPLFSLLRRFLSTLLPFRHISPTLLSCIINMPFPFKNLFVLRFLLTLVIEFQFPKCTDLFIVLSPMLHHISHSLIAFLEHCNVGRGVADSHKTSRKYFRIGGGRGSTPTPLCLFVSLYFFFLQILPNNVQAFQPPPLKSTTPPTSRHGHVTSSTNSYLSD